MSDVIFYTTDDGATKIDLRLENGTVWLSQLQIAELFQTSKQNISKHIQAIYDDQELDEQATVNHELTVQKEGEREHVGWGEERTPTWQARRNDNRWGSCVTPTYGLRAEIDAIVAEIEGED